MTAQDKINFDSLRECRLSKLIAKMRCLSDEFGNRNLSPQSCVCVNEDFWYMRGDKGKIDSIAPRDKTSTWPSASIFHARLPDALSLNPTLSQTVCGVPKRDTDAIERLKQVLFENCCQSRKGIVVLTLLWNSKWHMS